MEHEIDIEAFDDAECCYTLGHYFARDIFGKDSCLQDNVAFFTKRAHWKIRQENDRGTTVFGHLHNIHDLPASP